MYGRRLDQCGTTAQGVFWRDDEWHVQRFVRFAEVFSSQHTVSGGVTINDLGCGYGAFFDYLAPLPIMHGSTYYGYDIAQEMIAACRDRINDTRAVFLRKMEATHQADYSFACGTYNLCGHADRSHWQDYVEDSIKQLWQMSDVALAFNMLRDDAADKYDGLHYIDPQYMEDFCRTHLSANVVIFDEHPLPDVTYFVRR